MTLSVSAGGSPTLGYQWRLNGANIPGATSASYTVPSFNLSQAGNYVVTVANGFGAVDSQIAGVTVNLPNLPLTDNFAARVAVSDRARSGLSSNVGATQEPGEPNHAAKPASGILTINTDGSNFDTVLAVYISSGPGVDFSTLVSIACDNDSGLDGRDSSVSLRATKDVIYYVAVDGRTAGAGPCS